jgi:hypothetical protein
MTTATLTIVVIAVLIVWNVFGGKRDLDRRHRRGQDPGTPE